MVTTIHPNPDPPAPSAGIDDTCQLRRMSRHSRRHEGGHWCVTDTVTGRQQTFRVRLFRWPTVAMIEDPEAHRIACCQHTGEGWHVAREAEWLSRDLAVRLAAEAEADWCRVCRRTALAYARHGHLEECLRQLQCERPECAEMWRAAALRC